MSEATSAPKSAPLMENEHVKELLAIMKANSVDAREFNSVLRYVGAMERQLDKAVGELIAMRRELNDMREAQNHPVRRALQNAISTLEEKIAVIRERLDAVKAGIIEGAKNAVAAFKEKGISALSNLASFFHIKNGLKALRNGLNDGIKADERAIAAIESVSAKYHEAGRRVKNMGRALADKEAVQEAKPSGKLAKSLEAPFRNEKAALSNALKNVNAAIRGMEQLEAAAAQIREAKAAAKAEKKPSLLKNLEVLKEKAAQAKRDVPERPARQQEASI